jgi:LemA protein
MELLLTVFVLLSGVLLASVVYIIGQYNGLVSLRNHIRESWSNVDTELKRRHDLIPNLVSVVKGYAQHEQTVLEHVIQLRNSASQAQAMDERSGRESQLSESLRSLLAVVENYPDLKADAQFLRLQQELIHTEDRIQAARRFYNGNVRDYQNKCGAFPSNLVAQCFSFQAAEFFQAGPDEKQPPPVTFNPA